MANITATRKLKLHMDMSVDGFVAGPEGQLDWLTGWLEDEQRLAFENQFTDSFDTILLGRKTAEGFTSHWESVRADSPDYPFARRMVDIPKIVFSETLKSHPGQNVRVENGPTVKVVKNLKQQAGKDILVYGGVAFVSFLLENKLIDELNFVVNPVAIGEGMRIFTTRMPLKLTASRAFAKGVVLSTYEPQ